MHTIVKDGKHWSMFGWTTSAKDAMKFRDHIDAFDYSVRFKTGGEPALAQREAPVGQTLGFDPFKVRKA